MKVSNQAQVSNIYRANNQIPSKKKTEKPSIESKEPAKKLKSNEAVHVTISEEGRKLASKKYSNLRIMKINSKVYH